MKITDENGIVTEVAFSDALSNKATICKCEINLEDMRIIHDILHESPELLCVILSQLELQFIDIGFAPVGASSHVH